MSVTNTLMRARREIQKLLSKDYPGTAQYWNSRYGRGGNSGPGSRDRLADFKADILNRFVARHGIESVIEFGCGDGFQLGLSQYPQYFGVDVSEIAVETCRRLFAGDATKRFGTNLPPQEKFDLALSLDVIFHLVEDQVFSSYMENLFKASRKWVIVYSSNIAEEEFRRKYTGQDAPHVKHRNFSRWIESHAQGWKLIESIPNKYPFRTEDPERTSFADFYIYEKQQDL